VDGAVVLLVSSSLSAVITVVSGLSLEGDDDELEFDFELNSDCCI
jgi:hypothetical protein